MLKLLFYLLLFSIFFYCFYQLNQFVKGFTFLTNGNNAESELEESNQLENDFESFNGPSETVQKTENENEDSTDLNSFYDTEDVLSQSKIKKCRDLVTSVDNYVQRYISLFLITSNLKGYKVTDENEEIKFELEISISGQDLTYLQGYSKNSKSLPHLKSLSKLDRIFSKIARAKERSYMESAMWFSKSFLASIFSKMSQPSFQSVLIFLIICIGSWIFLLYSNKQLYFCLGIIINSALIWEGLNKYWKKLKEADVEIYVNTLRRKPKDCDPDKMGWYDSFLSLFSENQCLQYYKNLHKNPEEDVTLFKCIVDTYSFYLIEMPIKLFGSSIRDFTEEISVLCPWPLRFLANIPLAIVFTSFAGFFILLLFGKRLRLSFFGAAVEIGDTGPKPYKEKFASLTANESPKTVRIIRKLKPWTKPRFPKRLEKNDLRLRKLYLKSPTSTAQVKNGKELQSGSLRGEICSTATAKED